MIASNAFDGMFVLHASKATYAFYFVDLRNALPTLTASIMDQDSEIGRKRSVLRQEKKTLRASKPSRVTRGASKTKPFGSSNHVIDQLSSASHMNSFSSSFHRAVELDINLPPSSAVNSENKNHRRELLGQVTSVSSLGLLPADRDNHNQKSNSSRQSSQGRFDGRPLQFEVTLRDDATALRRTTGLKMHTKFDDVILTSHGGRSDGKLSADPGVIGIWSLEEGRGVLQRLLNCNSGISAMETPRISPTLVLAGTETGAVLVWDTRVKSGLPIHALEEGNAVMNGFHDRQRVTGVKTTFASSPFFVSTSERGTICKWTLSKPEMPLSKHTLQENEAGGELSISSMDFPQSARLMDEGKIGGSRMTSIFVGSENGGIHRVNGAGSSWNVESGEVNLHEGAVTCVASHRFGHENGLVDDVVVTSSEDWSVKVWHFRKSQECVCLKRFDTIEHGVVNDVSWSNEHATLFCTGGEDGVLTLFDLSGELNGELNGELSESGGRERWEFRREGQERKVAITSVQWDRMSRNVYCGDSEGAVSVWRSTSTLENLPDVSWMSRYVKRKGGEG